MAFRFAATWLCLAGSVLQAQQYLQLKLDETRIVPGPPGGSAFVGAGQCDDRSNIYFRQYSGPSGASRLARIDADASRQRYFDLASAEGVDRTKPLFFSDFAVDGSSVYIPLTAPDGTVSVVRFSTEGEYESTTKLAKLHPLRFGTLPGGQFLVFGYRLTRENPDPKDASLFQYATTIEIYSSSGQLLKNVDPDLPDVNLNAKGVPAEEKFSALSLASSATGPDGFYVLPRTPKLTLSVISAAGEIVRQVELPPPGADYFAGALQIRGRQVLVQFSKTDAEHNVVDTIYQIYDAYSGERGTGYRVPNEAGGVCGCYDWKGGFTFLAVGEHGRRLLKYASAGR